MDLDLLNLSKHGIRKKKYDHEFIYRYPSSSNMPKFNHDGFSITTKKAALYLHLPFCSSPCKFCHYYKIPKPNPKQITKYLEYVKKEIKFYNGIKATSLFLGGGTPTFLESEQLIDIYSYLNDAFSIGDIEKTIESSPETLNNKKINTLADLGFNRLSIGVQSFNDSINKNVGRAHNTNQSIQAINQAKDAGFKVNVDLIYGLPSQDTNSWKESLEKAYRLNVDSITASELRVLPGSYYYYTNEKFASEKKMLGMHETFIDFFHDKGYNLIFPYQYSKQKFDFLETQWGNKQFLGLGASSCSYIDKWDYNNAFPLGLYYKYIDKYGYAAIKGKKLNLQEQMLREILLGLKIINKGISKKELSDKYGLNNFKVFDQLADLKLIDNNQNITLTTKGTLFSDEVANFILRKFQASHLLQNQTP
jgi:oxygen-independent coproporphyrinogen III oxidase